ncbi:5'-phosphoribosylglycinamide transformylase [Erythrobacter sp. NAP1]|uniref:UrcA family protein n=1 Tax=Erythrobacter sp. NAP1 TaxID=237727 RepID=UPI000068779F|nr:UrcA family protein [Erythrobacter sp. NAP1]EAQ28240.1 5'-phosphoribosylglycinamide transformylase [Erythrobacter sp. NAP1]
MFNRKTVSAVMLSIAAITASPVSAQTSIEVDAGAYNLADEAGQRALNAELKKAVRQICGVTPPLRDLHDVRNHRACVISAETSFMADRSAAIAAAQSADAQRMAIAERSADAG